MLVLSALALLAGCVVAQDLVSLSLPLVFAASCAFAFIGTRGQRRSHRLMLPLSLLGGALLSWRAVGISDAGVWREPREVTEAVVAVRLLGGPHDNGFGVSTLAETRHRSLPQRLRLRWPQNPGLREGDCWQVRLQLTPTEGVRRKRSDRVSRVGGEAKVRGEPIRIDCDSRRRWTVRARGQMRSSILSHLKPGASRAVVRALVLGERAQLGSDLRRSLQRTGLSHLMAISGLHVGLAATIGFWLLRLMPIAGAVTRSDMGWLGAILAAVGYAFLSGFAMPAQRALLAIVLIAFASWTRIRIRSARIVALAMWCLVVADPLIAQSPGFWMSFGAVGLLASHQALRLRQWLPERGWRHGVRAQLLMSLTLGLAVAFGFGMFSVVSLGLNLLVIPWFAFCVVPLLFLAVIGELVIPAFAGWLWVAASRAVEPVLWAAQHVAQFDWSAIAIAPVPTLMMVFLLTGSLWISLAQGHPGRAIGWVGIVSLPFIASPAPPKGCLDVRLHDVGHGLAATVRSDRAWWQFDAGSRWPGGSAAERAVVPFLHANGARRIERAIQSHSDLDHRGGFDDLRRAVPIEHWLGTAAWPCTAGQRWHRDGVRFEVLWPMAMARGWSDNDASCVVRVSLGGVPLLLLPGDVEARAEAVLAVQSTLHADVVIVPHHGSITSSSAAFVAAAKAREAWVPNARRRGWQMPHPEVVRRWQTHGAILRETAMESDISSRLCARRSAR